MDETAAAAGAGAGARRAFALALGGGNALGAYHLGVAESLEAATLWPDRLVGCSIGAVTAAILAGNPPERRLERLRAFWRLAAHDDATPVIPVGFALRGSDSDDAGLRSLLFGRPGLFRVRFPGLLSALPWVRSGPALRDHAPLARTLAELIDFGRLNAAETPVEIVALDVETGAEVWFDTRRDALTPEHLLAATALLPLFAPVTIEGRALVDGGLSSNLPIRRVFETPPERDLLCVAVDLFALAGDRPRSFSGSLTRAQDLSFACQSRHAVEAVARERALVAAAGPGRVAAVTLAWLAYRGAPWETAGKGLDFSRRSIEARRAQGRADMDAMLARIAAARPDAPFVTLRLDDV